MNSDNILKACFTQKWGEQGGLSAINTSFSHFRTGTITHHTMWTVNIQEIPSALDALQRGQITGLTTENML